jgi:uncharacterized membrane protein YcfT
MSAPPVSSNRFNWVDLSKGICVIAVVMLYSRNAVQLQFGESGWLHYVVEFCRPFRMPDFFLISGLFLARVIDRPWLQYLDKKIVHYCYFFALWTLLNLTLRRLTGGLEGDLRDFLGFLFGAAFFWPFQMLWFIQMLPLYFLFTRLTHRVPVWLMLLVASLLQAFPPFEMKLVIIDEFWNRYIYFYAGYALAPWFFKLADTVTHYPRYAVAGLGAWGMINGILVFNGVSQLPFISLFLGFAGASAIVAVAALISNMRAVKWLRYIGEHSIVAYLAFYWPMISVQAALVALGWSGNTGFFGAIITAAGVFGAFVIYWTTLQTGIAKWLFERPAWLTIDIKPRTGLSASNRE